jgi:hypothetical protein
VSAPSVLVLTLSPDELRDLVRGEVAAALAVRAVSPSPTPFVDGRELCRLLACSPATRDRLVRAGMPHVLVSESRRYDVAACHAWLEARTEAPAPRALPALEAAPARTGVRRVSAGRGRR